MPVMTEFTVRPFATVPVDGDAGDLLDGVLTALEADPRALGPVVGYDYATRRVNALFQVDVDADGDDARRAATDRALTVFDQALVTAGGAGPYSTEGWTIVEGDDPDQLP